MHGHCGSFPLRIPLHVNIHSPVSYLDKQIFFSKIESLLSELTYRLLIREKPGSEGMMIRPWQSQHP